MKTRENHDKVITIIIYLLSLFKEIIAIYVLAIVKKSNVFLSIDLIETKKLILCNYTYSNLHSIQLDYKVITII